MARFTRKDTGCYADGTHGHQHCRETLGNLVTGWLAGDRGAAMLRDNAGIALSLSGPMPDDAWDEIEALEILNEQCDDGVAFEFFEGSLYLLETDHATPERDRCAWNEKYDPFIVPPGFGGSCGHSACRQNYIETGELSCIVGDAE